MNYRVKNYIKEDHGFSLANRSPGKIQAACTGFEPFCTVVLMSCLVNMSSDVMWYASQSGHVIYRGSRGIGLVKNLRCSLVFEQNLQF